jgi:hypothetical protein
MSETVSPSAPQATEEDAMTIRQLFAEIRQMNAQMQSDQERIVRLKIETDALRGETQRLKAETRAALARMGEPV